MDEAPGVVAGPRLVERVEVRHVDPVPGQDALPHDRRRRHRHLEAGVRHLPAVVLRDLEAQLALRDVVVGARDHVDRARVRVRDLARAAQDDREQRLDLPLLRQGAADRDQHVVLVPRALHLELERGRRRPLRDHVGARAQEQEQARHADRADLGDHVGVGRDRVEPGRLDLGVRTDEDEPVVARARGPGAAAAARRRARRSATPGRASPRCARAAPPPRARSSRHPGGARGRPPCGGPARPR